eukprot:1715763-Rhodomonas_salina.1
MVRAIVRLVDTQVRHVTTPVTDTSSVSLSTWAHGAPASDRQSVMHRLFIIIVAASGCSSPLSSKLRHHHHHQTDGYLTQLPKGSDIRDSTIPMTHHTVHY